MNIGKDLSNEELLEVSGGLNPLKFGFGKVYKKALTETLPEGKNIVNDYWDRYDQAGLGDILIRP